MIELHGICKTYKNNRNAVPVLNDISLHIRPGEIVSVTGPSGSGKSTLMNILGCLDLPSSGTYQLDGKLVNMASESSLAQIRNNHLGMIFQNPNLLPSKTVLDNVKLPLQYGAYQADMGLRLSEVIDMLGIRGNINSYPHQLSALEQQRVGIARALINQPSVLVADEPTGNLDSSSGEDVLGTLQQLNEELGLTVIIATHDQEVAVCTRRVINIRDGVLMTDKVVIQTRLSRSQ